MGRTEERHCCDLWGIVVLVRNVLYSLLHVNTWSLVEEVPEPLGSEALVEEVMSVGGLCGFTALPLMPIVALYFLCVVKMCSLSFLLPMPSYSDGHVTFQNCKPKVFYKLLLVMLLYYNRKQTSAGGFLIPNSSLFWGPTNWLLYEVCIPDFIWPKVISRDFCLFITNEKIIE